MQGDDILKIIESKRNTMSKGHKAIASFIIEHYDAAAYITASKLGETAGVSESTVVRFACALGYDGYPELQKHLQKIHQNTADECPAYGPGGANVRGRYRPFVTAY